MDFGVNKIPVEAIKEESFGRTYFRDIYSGVNYKWYRKSWKVSDELRNIDQNYYCSNSYDVNDNKYKVKSGTSLRLEKIKVRLILQNLIAGFNGILDIGCVEDLQMIKDKLLDEKEL